MKGYIVTYKNGCRKGYTSLAAIYAENTKEELGVSKFTLDRFDFSNTPFINEKCIIEMFTFKTKGEIIKDRKKY